MNDIERRDIRTEVRAMADVDGSLHIKGKSPVFGKLSEDLGGWREVIEQDAFDGLLEGDVRGRFDDDLILGRTKNGTLKLTKEEDGIAYDITINPEDAQAVAAYARVKRGDVDGASFMFILEDKGERWEKGEDGQIVRHILKASELLDVGPVAYPAYVDATAHVRSKIDEFQRETAAVPSAEAERIKARQKARARRLTLLSI